MLTGEYRIAIDEKGRIMVPSRLRSQMDVNSLIITKSSDSRRCLQVLTKDDFEALVNLLSPGPLSSFSKERVLLQMRIVAPAQEEEFDKQGRISIPPTLRSFANIELKKEIVLVGIVNRILIFNTQEYERYLTEIDDENALQKAAEAISKGGNVC